MHEVDDVAHHLVLEELGRAVEPRDEVLVDVVADGQQVRHAVLLELLREGPDVRHDGDHWL